MNKIDGEKLLIWLSNKRNYAQGHLRSESISESEHDYYATQNDLLGDIIRKIKSGSFNIDEGH